LKFERQDFVIDSRTTGTHPKKGMSHLSYRLWIVLSLNW